MRFLCLLLLSTSAYAADELWLLNPSAEPCEVEVRFQLQGIGEATVHSPLDPHVMHHFGPQQDCRMPGTTTGAVFLHRAAVVAIEVHFADGEIVVLSLDPEEEETRYMVARAGSGEWRIAPFCERHGPNGELRYIFK